MHICEVLRKNADCREEQSPVEHICASNIQQCGNETVYTEHKMEKLNRVLLGAVLVKATSFEQGVTL